MSAPRLSRRSFTTAALVAAAAVASPGLRAQGPRLEKVRPSLSVASKSAIAVLPLTIAERLGFFRHEGLDIDIIEYSSSAHLLHDGVGRASDVLCGPFEQVIQLQGRSQPFQAFVLQGRAPQVAMGVSTRSLPVYRRVADLRGRRIGIATPGSSPTTVARLVLARGGLHAADVDFVGIAEDEALGAMRAGQIDAISHIDPLVTQLEQRGEMRIISDTRTLKGTQEIFGGPMPASCLYAAQEFVQRHPATCQAITNGMVHALKWLQTAGPSDLIKVVPEAYFMGDRALYLAAFTKVREAISPDGLIPPEGVHTALRTMAAFDPGVSAEKVDANRCFTNDFARRAKDKFRA